LGGTPSNVYLMMFTRLQCVNDTLGLERLNGVGGLFKLMYIMLAFLWTRQIVSSTRGGPRDTQGNKISVLGTWTECGPFQGEEATSDAVGDWKLVPTEESWTASRAGDDRNAR
jgi:hypothetical protein